MTRTGLPVLWQARGGMRGATSPAHGALLPGPARSAPAAAAEGPHTMARLPHSAIEHQVLDLSLNGRSEPARSPGSAYPPGSCISSAGPVPLATDSATDTSKAASTVPEYSCSRRHYRRLIAGVR